MRIEITAETWNKIMNMGKQLSSTDGARPVLQGIHIVCDDTGACRAESVDGYVGGTLKFHAHGVNYVSGECLIPVQACRKYGRYNPALITIDSDGENVTFSDYNGSMTVKEINGNYLDMQRVYPTAEPAATVYINPAYLEKILKACKGEKLVKVEFRRGIDPVRIATAEYNMLCLPVRSDEKEW